MPKHSAERLWSLFGRVWCDAHARLGPEKAVEMVEAGSNLRLENKLMTMDYETAMRSWMADPEDSESDDDEDEGGRCYCRWSMSILERA